VQLQTLEGIGAAREDLYASTIKGEIPEKRAAVAGRLLKDQQDLKGTMRMKALSMVMGNKRFDVFAADLAQGLVEFVNGPRELPEKSAN
jgi:hypothetical protein